MGVVGVLIVEGKNIASGRLVSYKLLVGVKRTSHGAVLASPESTEFYFIHRQGVTRCAFTVAQLPEEKIWYDLSNRENECTHSSSSAAAGKDHSAPKGPAVRYNSIMPVYLSRKK